MEFLGDYPKYSREVGGTREATAGGEDFATDVLRLRVRVVRDARDAYLEELKDEVLMAWMGCIGD